MDYSGVLRRRRCRDGEVREREGRGMGGTGGGSINWFGISFAPGKI